MGCLFHLPALVRVELYFESAAALMIPPAGVDALVFLIGPGVLTDAELVSDALENRCCLIHSVNILLTIGNKCVANAVMDLVRKLLDWLIWFVSDQFSQSLFEPIGFLEGVLLRIFDQRATFELGFDAAHGRGEATFAIVAVGVAPFGGPAFGKPLVGGMGLIRREMAVLP